MRNDPDYGGPTFEQRRAVYASFGLSPENVREVESMVAGSGAREVARAALRNVPVIHVSQKNGGSRTFESHTCELVYAYELELDHDVLGYYAQVPCRRVERVTSLGRRHISSATLDFLVFRTRHIELVECKQEEWLVEKKWERDGNSWLHQPYGKWAEARGLRFVVWTSPVPCGIYQRNLEACYSVLTDRPEVHPDSIVHRVQAHISSYAATLDEIRAAIPQFSQRTALWMLANGRAFAPLKSVPIEMSDRFKLYSSKEQAEQLDAVTLDRIRERQHQPVVTDPSLSASATDFMKARQRLERLQQIAAGLLPQTKRMQALQKKVDAALCDGRTAISACLTNYAKSGNRSRRVLDQHVEAMEKVVELGWNTGKVRRPKDLFYEFEDECRRVGVEPCGRAALDVLRRRQSLAKRALMTGGLRAYQAQRTRTDPRSRSLPPLGYGQVLHIDSSDFDVRTAPDLVSMFPAAKPRFYIGVDGASEMPMSHSLIYGPARTDGLALLLREHVQRHGFLPKMIHLDRGSENRSKWIEDFCLGRISLRYSPTAGSQWNGIAEAAILRVNQGVADHMAGSTLPDKFGRAVDGKFKSRANARTAFTEVCAEFDRVVYGDMPEIPNAEDVTPAERVKELSGRYGCFGTPCEWSEEFLIQTSIAVKIKSNLDKRKGVRTEEGWYTSDELLSAMLDCEVQELRSDCADPNVMYVKVGLRWIKAYHNRLQSTAALTQRELQHDLLEAPSRRSNARRRREGVARKAHSRRQLALAAAHSTAHLRPRVTEPKPEPEIESNVSQKNVLVRQAATVEPFDEKEDF